MSKRRKRKTTGTIDKYLVQEGDSSESDKTCEIHESESVQLEKNKMAKVTNAELKELMLGMEKKMDNGFSKLEGRVDKLGEKLEALEFDVEQVKATQEDDRANVHNLEEEVETLKNSLLLSQVYSRKYHLILYGVDGFETEPVETMKRVRRFAIEDLKLETDFVQRVVIRNAHRLQKRDSGPTPIIVVFLLWEERNAFLKSGKQLAQTKMSIRTDLPPVLKKKRGELATKAYEIRRDEKLQTRIIERGIDIYIETRKASGDPWSRRSVPDL